MNFPEITNKDFSTDSHAVQQMLDYAYTQWDAKNLVRERFEKLYNSYNGIISEKEIESVIKKYGKRSKTKYVNYRLGRSKLKQLHGEYLEIPVNAQVTTVNRTAQNEKMQKYKNMLGMSLAKPQIEKARELGYNVFDGLQIPDKNNKTYWNLNNFKLANEIVMQHIINDKLKTQKMKDQLYQNFVDLTIAAEVFGKVERTIDGNDEYRAIPPKYALYEESVADPYLERSPYLGEVRYMYEGEILTNQEFNLNEQQKKIIENIRETYYKDENQGNLLVVNGHPAIEVVTIEWKSLETVYKKISPAKGSKIPYKRILDNKYYQKNKEKIERDVKLGRYKIEKYYREVIWSASRIAKEIYTKAKKEEYIIQILNENGKFSANTNYCGMLFSTINGYRVSMQEMIYELERIYDDIRFMINKELRKMRGDTLIYDKAFIPKGKLISDILYDVSDDGIVEYDSSAEGNKSGIEADSNKVGIGTLNLGQSQSLVILMGQAAEIERVMDKITGMNESRQGLEKATTTATTNMNNVRASRTMTFDMFYFMNSYTERMLIKLAEKTKLNKTYLGEDSEIFILSEDEMQYLMATRNIIQDNYSVSVTDGRKEQDILDKLEAMFPQEINAGMLRTKDVGEFYLQDNFASAIKVLDNAHKELAAIRQKEIAATQEAKNNETQSKIQIAQENREDLQEHEKEMELLKIEGQKELEEMKIAAKATLDYQNNLAKATVEKPENIFET
jgi:hypothetical protein